MSIISSVLTQLQQERIRINSRLASVSGALAALRKSVTRPPTHTISASGRARIAAAQKARWAKAKGKKAPSAPKKRKMSASAIARIRAAQKARWAKWRKRQKKA